MKKMSIIFLVFVLFLLLPFAANARQGGGIYFLLAGGKAWGSSLDGPFAASKIFLSLFENIWLQAGYNHYFNPTVHAQTPNKRSAFTIGLQFKSRETGRRIQWFVNGDGGFFRCNYAWNPDIRFNEFGLGLGAGLEKLLSDRCGLRFNIRGWTFFQKDSFFGDAWAETSLGFFFRL